MKTIKLIYISIALAIIISSCNLPRRSGIPTRTIDQNPAGTPTAITSQANPTQIRLVSATPISVATIVTVASTAVLLPPNTPAWSAYDYVCEPAANGSTMTMNLAWLDRSTSEESYKVYRGEQIIAILAPDSTFYTDVAFVPTGKTLGYSIEAFNKSWIARSNTITYGCQ